jgi:hypothetical protein
MRDAISCVVERWGMACREVERETVGGCLTVMGLEFSLHCGRRLKRVHRLGRRVGTSRIKLGRASQKYLLIMASKGGESEKSVRHHFQVFKAFSFRWVASPPSVPPDSKDIDGRRLSRN